MGSKKYFKLQAIREMKIYRQNTKLKVYIKVFVRKI